MSEAKFILSKKILKEQVRKLKDLGLKISYSYKTNREVGNLLQEISDLDFSIHAREEIGMIGDKSRIWFFLQAESVKEIEDFLEKGIQKFVVDNEIDLERVKEASLNLKKKVSLSFRMKFQEHRIGTGKYFVYGFSSGKVNELILKFSEETFVRRLGVHIHRKSQNTSEWEIKKELEDSLSEEVLMKIKFVNFGGGLPVNYRSYNLKDYEYIFNKINDAKKFLDNFGIESHIEPGRYLSGSCINLETEIVQVQENNLIINVSIYNCALDTLFTGTKMLVDGELSEEDEGKYYLIKGNSPTRDDIFRYKVKLEEGIKVGDKIVFLNAGAYNYATDFFGYKKLTTEIVD